MNIFAIIPARYSSSRFPGKPLAKIIGKPMIQHVYEAVAATGLFRQVLVATDHQEIYDCVSSFNGFPVMTNKNHASGTDRIYEVASKYDADAVVNVQGDEPLIDKMLLEDICHELENKEAVVSAAFQSDNETWFRSPDHVKVVVDKDGYALYFSRSGIPFCHDSSCCSFWHHIGIYGYQKEALERFVLLSSSTLEKREKLEQLRLLENGMKIKIIETAYQGFGVDRPEDLPIVESLLKI